ncbi:MAG: hypothetical protein Q4D60_01030 [Eubacteriales bacterium]|nr:hypothetical protein [Eubacteriales bacterium]
MINPFLKAGWLREGRNIRLPLTIIFYNAIMAFVMILFMVFNEESFQKGYYYDTSTYQYQFLIICSFQILAVFLMMPFSVSRLFLTDKEKNMIEQFEMIPGVSIQYIMAKLCLVVEINGLLFFSSLPVMTLCCIYTGISGMKILRLGAMILLYTFWGASISIFFYTVCEKTIWAFAGTVCAYLAFCFGTLVMADMIRNTALMMSQAGEMTDVSSHLCLVLLLLNPLSSYMGYYGSVTGDVGIFSTLCSHLGIDTTKKMFIFLFYKTSSLLCVLVGCLFLALSVWYMEKRRTS